MFVRHDSKQELPGAPQHAPNLVPRAFPFLSLGRREKAPGTGRSHDFQHPDIVGVINYNNNE